MRHAFALALMLSGLSAHSWAVDEFRLGGIEPWAAWTGQQRMMDDATDPSALQPRELKPGENLLPQLGPWYRWRFPGESTYRLGDVRIWRGINYLRPRAEPRDFVDGDLATFFSAHDYYDPNEFYTIDLGVPVPVDRFAFYPPAGRDALHPRAVSSQLRLCQIRTLRQSRPRRRRQGRGLPLPALGHPARQRRSEYRGRRTH